MNRVAWAVALFVAACGFAQVAQAQTAVVVVEAELGVPFGVAKGQLAFAGRQLVFVSAEKPAASLAIDRADISDLRRAGDVVTITTRRPLRDADGERSTFRFRLTEPTDLTGWYESSATDVTSAASAKAPVASTVIASYSAKHDHSIGSCQGTLIFTTGGVSFESNTNLDHARQWQLIDIKEVGQNGAYKFKVEPFRGDTFNFELAGQGIDSGEYRQLVDRIARARTGK